MDEYAIEIPEEFQRIGLADEYVEGWEHGYAGFLSTKRHGCCRAYAAGHAAGARARGDRTFHRRGFYV